MKHPILSLASGVAVLGLSGGLMPSSAVAQDTKDIRCATSSVRSSVHRSLVRLSPVLHRNMDEISITVMPTPGAAASVRGFAGRQFDGYYGADVAFHEIAGDTGRYVGFEAGENELLQSFWAYTLEMGLGIRAEDADELEGWRSLRGHPVFTGPAPWDTRAALVRAMDILEI